MIAESAIPALWGRDEFRSDFDIVADFPRSEFSVEDVRRAGGVIAGDLHWSDETAQGIR
jgi:hypothetical protein